MIDNLVLRSRSRFSVGISLLSLVLRSMWLSVTIKIKV